MSRRRLGPAQLAASEPCLQALRSERGLLSVWTAPTRNLLRAVRQGARLPAPHKKAFQRSMLLTPSGGGVRELRSTLEICWATGGSNSKQGGWQSCSTPLRRWCLKPRISAAEHPWHCGFPHCLFSGVRPHSLQPPSRSRTSSAYNNNTNTDTNNHHHNNTSNIIIITTTTTTNNNNY